MGLDFADIEKAYRALAETTVFQLFMNSPIDLQWKSINSIMQSAL